MTSHCIGSARWEPLLRGAVLGVSLVLASVAVGEKPRVLRLATTTSTADSGLLNDILGDFERSHGARVDVIAVGTGQALALGRSRDADVLLVHAPASEAAFLAEGHGTARVDVMYNDFIVVGPRSDPAQIRGMGSASAALAQIAHAKATFASRGDDSGTHTKEKYLWSTTEEAGARAEGSWYHSLGQGMGATLRYAAERQAYTLTDRGTFLSQRNSLPGLDVLVGGRSLKENPDSVLRNPYGLVLVSQDAGVAEGALAQSFSDWITSPETQARIAVFGRVPDGQPLFYPAFTSRRDSAGTVGASERGTAGPGG